MENEQLPSTWRLEYLRGHRDYLKVEREEKHDAYRFYKKYYSPVNAAEYKQHVKEYDAAISRLDKKIRKEEERIGVDCGVVVDTKVIGSNGN
jgi:hypothetical protein